LNLFKFHIELPHIPVLTLQFDSPSRRFYLSVVALVVREMKRVGRVTSISLEEHGDILGLLNETIGESAGSSHSARLLPRIYRKWKSALPDLENAPLFTVLGRKRDYEESVGLGYRFTEEQRDAWANLFEYRGSEEHVRLQLSVDKIGMSLDDVTIIYGEDPALTDDAAWDAFIASLRRDAGKRPQPALQSHKNVDLVEPRRKDETKRWPFRWRWQALGVAIAVVATFAAWQYVRYFPHIVGLTSEKEVVPILDRPSIAVLPFVNMSGDPGEEYFSDGVTEEIITALSHVENLFVIARSSVFTYKGMPVKVQQVAEDLGVQYVLEGSVRKSSDRLRITAQLLDARRGIHVWGERYDRDLKELFVLQDEITMKIITTLEVTLTEGEQARIAGSGTDNLDAYLKILRARDLLRHQNVEDNHKARKLVEEAIVLDPGYAHAYRWLAGSYYMDVWLGTATLPQESLEKAAEFAQKSIAMDDAQGGTHGLLGNIFIMTKEYEKGVQEAQRAVELEPNGADAHAFLGMGLRFADRAEEAIPVLRKAIRLDPRASGWYMHILAGSYRNVGDYEEAIQWGEKAVWQNPQNVASRIELCSIYSQSDLMDKACEQAREIMRLNPNFSVERFARALPQKNPVLKKCYLDALRNAGLR